MLLSRSAAEQIWTVDGSPDLVRTPDQYYSSHAILHLLSNGNPGVAFGLLGPDIPPSLTPIQTSQSDLFRTYMERVKPAQPKLSATFLHSARPLTLSAAQRMRPVPFAPTSKDFSHAAAWIIHVSWPSDASLSNVFLNISYTGDVARLYSGKRLLDDNFWNGTVWQLGMQPWKALIDKRTLRLLILPAPQKSAIGDTGKGTEALRHKAQLLGIAVTPQYRLDVSLAHSPNGSVSFPGHRTR